MESLRPLSADLNRIAQDLHRAATDNEFNIIVGPEIASTYRVVMEWQSITPNRRRFQSTRSLCSSEGADSGPHTFAACSRRLASNKENGKAHPAPCLEAGITEQTSYYKRRKYGGMKMDDATGLRELDRPMARGSFKVHSVSAFRSFVRLQTAARNRIDL